ncbi:MAG: CBS domain-containing protein, partial [Oligoflexia bacterium]|nr:CBS domain-containing protein [Oligoflexia bacterium]
AKDFISLLNQPGAKFELKRFMRRAYFVSNTKKVDRLLEEFRRDAVHFAVVLDEYGGVDGVVTLEDLIEEIVGEIFDEHDSPLEEASVVRTTSGDLLVDGSMLIDDLNINHDFDFPEGEYDTLAGFFIHSLGRIPALGEELEFKHLKLRVEEMSHNRITQVRIVGAKKTSDSRTLQDQSFEPSHPGKESNHKGPEGVKRLNASGVR